MKTCTKCKELKSINEFSKNKLYRDNHACWCKACSKLYRLNNKEKLKKYNENYRKINYKKIKEKNDEYLRTHREEIYKKAKLYRRNNPVKVWCISTVKNHRLQNHKVLFKWQELLPVAIKAKNCSICNIKLDWSYKNKRGKLILTSPTLDRKNNGKILTLNNTWIICFSCNATKRNRTLKEFIDYCNLVIKNIGKEK